MKFTEDLSSSKLNHITGFGQGYVIVQNKKINTAHIIAPDGLVSWNVNTHTELTADSIHRISKLDPEVIILGTGEIHIIPEKPILKALVETRVGFEIMDTKAACRTYNILVAEGRRAVAALIL